MPALTADRRVPVRPSGAAGFPVGRPPVRPWVPGASSPTARPQQYDPSMRGPAAPADPGIGGLAVRAGVATTMTCLITAIPGGCWVVAVALRSS